MLVNIFYLFAVVERNIQREQAPALRNAIFIRCKPRQRDVEGAVPYKLHKKYPPSELDEGYKNF